jgi:hypothetical protein
MLSAAKHRPGYLLPSYDFSGFIVNENRFAFDALLNQPRHIWIKGSKLRENSLNSIDHPNLISPKFNAVKAGIAVLLVH